MVGLSAYMQNALIDFILRGFSAPTMPVTVYIALLNTPAINTDDGTTIMFGGGGTGQEPAAVDYSRLAYGLGPTTWTNTQNSGTGASTGSSATSMNVSAMNFVTALNSWGTINGVAVCDSLTGGEILFYGDLSAPVTIGVGDQFTFAINNLQLILQCP